MAVPLDNIRPPLDRYRCLPLTVVQLATCTSTEFLGLNMSLVEAVVAITVAS